MTLSEELTWRGFVNQTTYKDITVLDKEPIIFYWGVDPSADSMTVGNLAIAMMVRHFVAHGHKAILLVGGATGLIGDPDGKSQERDQKSYEEIEHNKEQIAAQYKQVFAGQEFTLVDNYDWFKEIGYLEFLRDVGKHVPMRQMLARDFVQNRLGEDGAGISYAEFSYALIQGYDFVHLFKEHGVTLQVCGSDQWGNCIAGVELIRRMTGNEASVWSAPLVVNKTTGVKFGKSEAGAVWLDPVKTSVYDFYQFWLNVDDAGAPDYLKYYTLITPEEFEKIMHESKDNPGGRAAQKYLAQAVTEIVHGKEAADAAAKVSELVVSQNDLTEDDFAHIKDLLPALDVDFNTPITELLVFLGLASSNREAREFLASGAIYINNNRLEAAKPQLEAGDIHHGIVVFRRGKNSVAVANIT